MSPPILTRPPGRDRKGFGGKVLRHFYVPFDRSTEAPNRVLDASVLSDRSRLISRDEISSAVRGATVRSATRVGPNRRWSRLWAWIPCQAGPWPGLTTAAVERAVAGGQI